MRKLILVLIFVAIVTLPAMAKTEFVVNGTLPGTVPIPGRLLIIGDSLTSGLYASSENNTYARLVADETDMQLARRYAGTLSVAIATWKEVRGWRPSAIVLEVGLNDVSKKEYGQAWEGDYLALVRDMQSTGARVTVLTTFWGSIQPSHPNFAIYEALNESIRDVSGETKANLADLWLQTRDCQECLSRSTDSSYFAPHYSGDNFHPSDLGHQRIAGIVISAMKRENTIDDSALINRLFFPMIER